MHRQQKGKNMYSKCITMTQIKKQHSLTASIYELNSPIIISETHNN